MKRCFLLIGFLLTNLIHGQMIINSYAYASVPVATEIFPQDNAASVSEVNSTGSFTATGVTLTSNAVDFYDGSYSIKAVSIGAFNYCTMFFPCVAGRTYTFSVWAKRGAAGTTQAIWLMNSSIVSSNTNVANITTTTWTEYTFSRVAVSTGNGQINFYSSFSGVAGDEVYIDKISIIETL